MFARASHSDCGISEMDVRRERVYGAGVAAGFRVARGRLR